MELIDSSSPELPPLVELGPPGRYRTPDAIQCLAVDLGGSKAPPQLRLQLEGGFELVIPLKQDAMRPLFDCARRHGADST
jgi:hypothetical protein